MQIDGNQHLLTALQQLGIDLSGELFYDDAMRIIYATDASIYRELPTAIAMPKNDDDIKTIIQFCHDHQLSIIPRTAGTSLAGQCVGHGIVVDVSKYFTKIIELNVDQRWVRVQPGVVRDELNAYLKPYGLFFSPITSTANRAMIGGMVGNNSCGTTSIVYGSTRDHVKELKVLLSDGAESTFRSISAKEFRSKCTQSDTEGHIYRHLASELDKPEIRQEIIDEFPKPSIHRRNTGYALDYLVHSKLYQPSGSPINLCNLLTGSEGTLAFTTEIVLDLDPLPDPYDVVVAAHFDTINDSMKSTQYAMEHRPTACELMDDIILECTKQNVAQSKNREFVIGDPKAVLLIEFRGKDRTEAVSKAETLIADLQEKKMGYAYPIVHPPQTKGVWALRSAGLGLLSNIAGEKKATTCIEDTAVALEDLADYIGEIEAMLAERNQRSVYYAHAGAGEIHLRPILNLKTPKGQEELFEISHSTAQIVKKYQGSLSGEHGDGRLRAQFIPMMVGDKNYELFKRVKHAWDPSNIFNPGKIVDAPPMNTSLRYSIIQEETPVSTILNFDNDGGILRSAEKCNGSGDCRKLPLSGGTMCPSYMATRNEKDTTRARANILREFLTKSDKENRFDHVEIKEVMDLCLSCKGCTSECPSGVDMAGLKAEWTYQYQKENGVPLRSKMFTYINEFNKIGSILPSFYNWTLTNSTLSYLIKKIVNVAPERSLPTISSVNLTKWYQQEYSKFKEIKNPIKTVYFFNDEFTNWNDTHVGIKAIKLLYNLGYAVRLIAHPESGRAALSKGLLERAKHLAQQNIEIFGQLINENNVLIGTEPSCILSFRDEYPRLVRPDLVDMAEKVKANSYLIEEFISNEIKSGHISKESFDQNHRKIKLHGHCHQKALSNIEDSVWALSIAENNSVEVIPSGCCGMAGSFGYEAEHYEISQQVGELVLFPAVRQSSNDTLIAASGTSCRHQIWDGAARKSFHPVEILYDSLLRKS